MMIFSDNGTPIIDIYDTKTNTWDKLRSDEIMGGYSYTVVRNKVYFLDSELSGCLGLLDPETDTWFTVNVPT